MGHRILKRLAKSQIRLGVCAGWSEHLLVAHTTLLEMSCRGSFFFFFFADKDVLIKATKNGIGLAKKELKQLFAIICHKSHTIKKVGVTEVLTNIAPQFDEIEKKTRCVIDLPAGVGHSDTSGGATWYEEEDDGNYLTLHAG